MPANARHSIKEFLGLQREDQRRKNYLRCKNRGENREATQKSARRSGSGIPSVLRHGQTSEMLQSHFREWDRPDIQWFQYSNHFNVQLDDSFIYSWEEKRRQRLKTRNNKNVKW
jgi:hypothetical protein